MKSKERDVEERFVDGMSADRDNFLPDVGQENPVIVIEYSVVPLSEIDAAAPLVGIRSVRATGGAESLRSTGGGGVR